MQIYRAPGDTVFSYHNFDGLITISPPGEETFYYVPAEDLIRFFVECWLIPKITRRIGALVDDLSDIISGDWG